MIRIVGTIVALATAALFALSACEQGQQQKEGQAPPSSAPTETRPTTTAPPPAGK